MKSILLALSITQQPEPFSLDESDAGLALSDIVRDSLRMQRFEFSDPLDFSFLLRSENEAAGSRRFATTVPVALFTSKLSTQSISRAFPPAESRA